MLSLKMKRLTGNRKDRMQPMKSMQVIREAQLHLDRYEAGRAQKRGGQIALVLEELAECIPDGDSREDIGERVALRDALNKFVSSLPDETQRVFIRRYWYTSSISEIARDYSMKEGNVAVLLLRTRKKLKKYLTKEGFEI